MERYSLINQDPKSPLTPLTPLSRNSAFSFNMEGDGSLREYINNIEFTPPAVARAIEKTANKPKHFSRDFQKKREVFEKPSLQITQPKEPAHGQREHNNVRNKRNSVSTSTAKKPQQAGLLAVPGQPMQCNNTPETPKSSVKSLQPGSKEQQQKQQSPAGSHFRQASPVAPRPLSPRIGNVLIKTGITEFKGLFQREEINIDVFRSLTPKELDVLGVLRPENRKKIMKAIKFAREFF